MGREALAGKEEECPHGSLEKRDRKRKWRIRAELLSFSARQGRLCGAENGTPDQLSGWPQLLSLSAVVFEEHPNPSLLSAEQLSSIQG